MRCRGEFPNHSDFLGKRHTYVRALSIYIYMYIWKLRRACIHACACERANVRAYMCACVCARTCVHANIFVLRPFNRKIVLEKGDSHHPPSRRHLNRFRSFAELCLGATLGGWLSNPKKRSSFANPLVIPIPSYIFYKHLSCI